MIQTYYEWHLEDKDRNVIKTVISGWKGIKARRIFNATKEAVYLSMGGQVSQKVA